MHQSIKQTVPPFPQPLDIVTLANYLRSDPDEDSESLALLSAQAAEEVERITGRVPLLSTYRLQQSAWVETESPRYSATADQSLASRSLEIPRTPLLEVTSVKYYDADGVQQTLSADSYIVCTDAEPGIIYLKSEYEWPELADRPDAVEIIFTAGISTTVQSIPARMKQAMLLLCRYYYAGGTPNEGDMGSDEERAMHILEGLKVGGWVK